MILGHKVPVTGWRKKEYTCPYCNELFKAGDIHFLYREDTDSVLDDEQNKEAPAKPEPLTSRPEDRKNGAERTSAEPPAAQPAVITGEMPQVFGVDQAEDHIAQRFLKSQSYLENMLGARFVRKGRYMKIGTKEQAANLPEYAFVPENETDFWDGNTPKQACFYKNGHVLTAEKRLCPKCHIDLPDAWFGCPEQNKHAVALAGGTSSGKTQYITMALHCMLESWAELELGTVQVELRSWFLNRALNRMRSGEDISSTATKGLLPFLVKIVPKGSNEAHYLILYDVAGEYTNVGEEDYARNARFREADVLLLMIDACGQRPEAVDHDEKVLQCRMSLNQCIMPLNRIQLYAHCKKIVGVVTKMDMLMKSESCDKAMIHGDRLGLTNGLLISSGRMDMHRNAIDLGTLKRMDREMENLFSLRQRILSAYGGEGVSCALNGVSTRQITVHTENDRYCVQKKLVIDTNDSADPCGHRLLEPLLRVMAELNILPVKNGDAEAFVPQPRKALFAGRKAANN